MNKVWVVVEYGKFNSILNVCSTKEIALKQRLEWLKLHKETLITILEWDVL